MHSSFISILLMWEVCKVAYIRMTGVSKASFLTYLTTVFGVEFSTNINKFSICCRYWVNLVLYGQGFWTYDVASFLQAAKVELRVFLRISVMRNWWIRNLKPYSTKFNIDQWHIEIYLIFDENSAQNRYQNFIISCTKIALLENTYHKNLRNIEFFRKSGNSLK